MSMLKDLFRNPLGASAVFLIIGTLALYVAHGGELPPGRVLVQADTVYSKIIDSLGIAVITAAIFGLLFEWVGKRSLIREAVASAVGQAKAQAFGVDDVVCAAEDIAYGSAIEHSSELIILT